MSLGEAPDTPNLIEPGEPFVVTAIVSTPAPPRSAGELDGNATIRQPLATIAAQKYPGAPLHEYAIGAPLCEPLTEVLPSELPIVLRLAYRTPACVWAFDYLGGPDYFASPEYLGEAGAAAPTPRTPEQLHAAEQAMIRQTLGLGSTEPIPQPAGPIPEGERPPDPYRFDPTPHMDLHTAEPPAPVPPSTPAPRRAAPASEPFPH